MTSLSFSSLTSSSNSVIPFSRFVFCNSKSLFSFIALSNLFWFSCFIFFRMSIWLSSCPDSVLFFSRNSFVIFFIDSDATSNLSIPIMALSSSLNSFGFALIIEFNSPCCTIDAIFNFSKLIPTIFSTCSVIDSLNCFLSPDAICILLLSIISNNVAFRLPLLLIFLSASYCLSFIENFIITAPWLFPRLINPLFDFLVCLPNNENVIASIMLDFPAPFSPTKIVTPSSKFIVVSSCDRKSRSSIDVIIWFLPLWIFYNLPK